MIGNDDVKEFAKTVLESLLPILNEKQKRLTLGIFSSALGRGGKYFLEQTTGAARNTITHGEEEVDKILTHNEMLTEKNDENDKDVFETRQRHPGAGRKPAREKYPDLYEKIEIIISRKTYGNPEEIIRWTTLSLRDIAAELEERFEIKVSYSTVSRAFEKLGYSKQQNQKMLQVGSQHPDRDAQFNYINETSAEYLNAGEPVISIDTKKKENIGNFKNNGSEYRKEKEPRQVLDHDFPLPELGKVAPYGIYLINENLGFVNLGTSHDTPEFAAESVRRWWYCVGINTFPNTRRIYITCDNGGSNGSRIWLWKIYLQELSNETGLEIHVSHYPPGTSKWNKVEHRLFCYISKNWEGQPLIDIETVVNLIGSTKTETGLKVICKVDENIYETGKKATDEQKELLNIEYLGPNEKWNYIIKPSV